MHGYLEVLQIYELLHNTFWWIKKSLGFIEEIIFSNCLNISTNFSSAAT